MTPGTRHHKSATLRVVVPHGLPEEMRGDVCEIASVNATARGRGDATTLMRSVCFEADQAWKTLFIHVEPFDDGAVSKEKLRTWYSKFGFKVIQESPCLMARSPERPRIVRGIR